MKRLRVVPFEGWLAYAAIVAGGSGLIIESTNPLDLVLPGWAVAAFSVAYMAAGVAMIVGLLLGKSKIEAVGLVIVGMSIVVRQVATVGYLGWSGQVAFGLLVNIGLIVACWIRLRSLTAGAVIVSV